MRRFIEATDLVGDLTMYSRPRKVLQTLVFKDTLSESTEENWSSVCSMTSQLGLLLATLHSVSTYHISIYKINIPLFIVMKFKR